MLRVLAALAVLLISAPAQAGSLSRWNVSPFKGVDAISVAGRTDSGILALDFSGDVWRSLDAGRTWTPVAGPGGPALYLLGGFAVGSPHDSRTWYATFRDRSYLTRDAGDTWSAVDHPVDGLAFGATPDLLYLPPVSADQFLGHAGRPGQVSYDGGATWRAMAKASDRFAPRFVVPSLSDAGVVYVWSSGGAARSDDQGATWREVTPPAGGIFYAAALSALAVDALDPDILYANTFTAVERGSFSSRDGGRTWTRVPLEWIVNTVPDPVVRGRAYAFSYNATVYETRDGGLTWTRVEGAQPPGASPANSGPPWMNGSISNYRYRPSSLAFDEGRRVALAVGYGTLASIDLDEGAVALGSDLWWNPAQPGSGMTITQHSSNRVFVVWYTYDAAGKQVWRVMPEGTWNDRTLSGTLYETQAPPYFRGAFDPSRVSSRPVGTASIEFSDQDNATFVHDGSRTPITRQRFGDPARATPQSYADLWWNAGQPGWGLGISHQGDRIFATWYVYGEDGRPMWVVMPDSVLGTEFIGAVAGAAARGDIYTTRGGNAGPPSSERIGSARILFKSPQSAELEYTVEGATQSVAITRQPF
jgi:photosystem II stability/assembly factor-like uncharacterized protein